MSQLAALLDANVLYPALIREMLMQLAVEELFRAKWTADIYRESIEALLKHEPHRDQAIQQSNRLNLCVLFLVLLTTTTSPAKK